MRKIQAGLVPAVLVTRELTSEHTPHTGTATLKWI